MSVDQSTATGREMLRIAIPMADGVVCVQHEIDHLNGVLISDYQHTAREAGPDRPPELPAVLIKARR